MPRRWIALPILIIVVKMWTFIVVVAAAAVAVTSSSVHVPSVDDFDKALHEHRKSRNADDVEPLSKSGRDVRQAALAKSAAVIAEHNSNPHRSFTMKWNAMSDLTDAEYLDLLHTSPDEVHPPSHHRVQPADSSRRRMLASDNSADTIDWSTKDGGKYVTPVKNQGSCGSCWAFTGAAVVESMAAIQSNTQAVPLSVEQILSCSRSLLHVQSAFPNRMVSSARGCGGGMTFLAYQYLDQLAPHGLTCEPELPYRMKLIADSYDTARCNDALNVSAAWDTGSSSFLSIQNDENAIVAALQDGPVSVSIDASGAGFRHYGGGIYDAADCKTDGIFVDHAVILVGYGRENGQLYWIIRNSWGSMWGEKGYMRMRRSEATSKSGPCNLFLYASQPKRVRHVANEVCDKTTQVVATPDLTLWAFWPTNVEQGALIYGVSAAVVVLGVVLHLYGEYRLAVNFPRQTYVDSFMRNQLPTQSQVLMHMAQRKAKQAMV
ncbi:hypothetical protein DYB36_002747 [Aphanomyces astaci]|uniref:Peptidase C1A papain C-terminal domain-containing protein n=1 Tax=Aphanomyces astaci TaxID=112090 RepID=A0A397ANW5_APHAT|nr:hypothetical protein DYB36_002747 [Aphanomyces astaci]